MLIGDHVTWKGRSYVLRGFDPFGVEDRRCYLEGAGTGDVVPAPFGEIGATAPEPATVLDFRYWSSLGALAGVAARRRRRRGATTGPVGTDRPGGA